MGLICKKWQVIALQSRFSALAPSHIHPDFLGGKFFLPLELLHESGSQEIISKESFKMGIQQKLGFWLIAPKKTLYGVLEAVQF